jgi:hypothetical protein
MAFLVFNAGFAGACTAVAFDVAFFVASAFLATKAFFGAISFSAGFFFTAGFASGFFGVAGFDVPFLRWESLPLKAASLQGGHPCSWSRFHGDNQLGGGIVSPAIKSTCDLRRFFWGCCP